MPVAKSDEDVRKYAVMGAQSRLASLREEERFILDRFPELRRAGAGASGSRAGDADGDSKARRWEMSPEARRAVSERMTKYWAARRKAKAAAAKAAKA